jgi:hypothetical protein
MASFLYADILKKKTLGCPSVNILQKAPLNTVDNYMALSMYAIANDCVIMSKRDSIEAVGYDPLNSEEIYQKIIYQKTGVYLYVLKSVVQVEQEGKKSSYRF